MLLQQVLEELSISLASTAWPIADQGELPTEDVDEVIKNPLHINIKDAKKKKSSTARKSWVAARAALLRTPLAARKLAASGPPCDEPLAPRRSCGEQENLVARGMTSCTTENLAATENIRHGTPLPVQTESVSLATHKHAVRGAAPSASLATQDPTATTRATEQKPGYDKHRLSAKEQKGSVSKCNVLQKKTLGPLTRNTNASNSQCLHRAAIIAKEIQVSNHGRLSAPALLANCLLSMISLADDDDDDDDVHQITNHRHSSASHYHHHHLHKETSHYMNHHDIHKSNLHHRSSSAHAGSIHKEHIHEIIHHRPSSAAHYHDEHDVHEIIYHRHSSAAHYHDDNNKLRHDPDVHEISPPARTSSAAHGNDHCNQKSTPDLQESKVSTLSSTDNSVTPADQRPRSAAKHAYLEPATHRKHKKMETFSCCLLGCGRNHSSKSMGSTLELLDNNSTRLDSYDPRLQKISSSNGVEIQDHQSRAMWGSCDLRRMVKRALLCNGIVDGDDLRNCSMDKDGQARRSKSALNDSRDGCHIDKDDRQGSCKAAGSSKIVLKDHDRVINLPHTGSAAAAGGSPEMMKRNDQLGLYEEGENGLAQGVLASHNVTVAATFVFSSSSTSSSTSSHSLKILQEGAVHPWLAAHSPSPGLALVPAASTSACHSSHEFDVICR